MLKRIALIVASVVVAAVLSVTLPTTSTAAQEVQSSSPFLIQDLNLPVQPSSMQKALLARGMQWERPKPPPLPAPTPKPSQPVYTPPPTTTTTYPVTTTTTQPYQPTYSDTVGPDVSGTWGALATCEEGGNNSATYGYFGILPSTWQDPKYDLPQSSGGSAGDYSLSVQEDAVIEINGHIPYAPWNCQAGGYSGW